MSYWLMKSEPDVFSIHDLQKKKISAWDGVRNYQARNFMKDSMRPGDEAFFYHSSADPSGIAGTITIASNAYPDPTQFDQASEYFDPKSTKENPRWMLVDVKFNTVFPEIITLQNLRTHKALKDMMVLRKGSRLSIQPVTPDEWAYIIKLAAKK